ncbi:hypothetical protein HDU93_002308 [Gonapodya sp. JEL0774]|nr:hypothetical protein HDU93_002308 [Gonapodya sp. JEL0774]
MADEADINPCPASIDVMTYEYTPADNAFLLVCAALVMIMTPGLGFYYSGMARSKNALTLIMLCFISYAVVTVQNLLKNAPTIPIITFQFYQLMFAIITPALIFGSAAERVRILPSVVFVFVWSTVVYSPIAYWAWSANGWLNMIGYLDFAGGTPVHASSGFAGLALALALGRRKHTEDFKASSIANVFLGTALLWFGWFGFNGGSELASNARSANAMTVTNISAAFGGLVWMLMDYITLRKMSGLGFCSGVVAGLVGITPASGFVSPASAFAIGGIVSAVCNTMVRLKAYYMYDDTLDSFNVHGIGGVTGDILTGVFAQRSIKAMNLYPNIGSVNQACLDTLPALGWLDGNWIQVAKQLAGASAGAAWSFLVTYAIVSIMQKIPGLQLRVSQWTEVLGSDQGEMGEMSYDYVESLSHVPDRSKSPPGIYPGVRAWDRPMNGLKGSESSSPQARIWDRQLIAAIEDGNLDLVRIALARGADVNSATKILTVSIKLETGETETDSRPAESALALAILSGRTDILHCLLENGADPRTPIEWPIPEIWENWTGEGGLLDRGRWRFENALELALAVGRPELRCNLRGVTLNFDNPSSLDEVSARVTRDPDSNVAQLLIRFGSPVTALSLEAIRQLRDEGRREFAELISADIFLDAFSEQLRSNARLQGVIDDRIREITELEQLLLDRASRFAELEREFLREKQRSASLADELARKDAVVASVRGSVPPDRLEVVPKVRQRCYAVHSFTAVRRDEVALTVGDEMLCIYEFKDGWVAVSKLFACVLREVCA